ncbi:hypothetical protein TVAG_317590 [Trichomonas vaginalis G3]|uniref:RSE1/DDB1/CPSF1 C-terminal domain-containing protein n=2 Tax=Trichomonas vaginalis (strain ATCC PRA-98 / G3) TaxID=412133 RepID=A2FTK8_TRIV3|nr:hypothetical protein TVAG_317590 [Trichomonas vaginalis G3]|eukprot:XP_001304700.1 hypothetical protein [Trichomonas vaginalis G3]
MEKKYWIHKTIRPSTYPINFITGNWFDAVNEGIEYTIINYLTHLQVFEVKLENGIYRSMYPKILQQFMSKVYAIVKGKPENGIDTFFALRKNDIVHYIFDRKEALFKVLHVLELKPLGINPTNLFMIDSLLITSCPHGSLSSFDINNWRITKVDKPTNFVLLSFITPGKTLCRIEGGNIIAYYNPYTLELLSKKSISVTGYKLFSAFQYMDGAIICYVSETESEEGIPPMFYYISENVELTEVDTLVQIQQVIHEGLPFDEKSSCFFTEKMEFYQISDELNFNVTKIPVTTREEHYFTKLLPFADKVLMAIAISGESLLISPPPTKHTLVYNFEIGQMGLEVSSPLAQVPYMVSYTNTPKSNKINLIRQGIVAASKGNTTISEAVTGLYHVNYDNRKIIAVSHANSTQFIELVNQCFTQTVVQGVKENSQTIGLGVILTRVSILIHARTDGVSMIFSDPNKPGDASIRNLENVSNVSLFASTMSQFLICFQKHRLQFISVPEADARKFNIHDFDAAIDVTAISFSGYQLVNRKEQEQVSPYADWMAIATTDGKNHAIRVYNARNFEENQFLTISMMCPVSSMAPLTSTRMCVGLENGIVVLLNYKHGTKPFVTNSLSIGQGPVRVSVIERYHVICTNSRTWGVSVNQKDIPKFTPVAIHSLSFVAGLGQQHFLAITGCQMELFRLDKGGELTQSKMSTKSPIVKLKPLDGTSFFFVCTKDDIKLYDIRGMMHNFDECGDDEVIKDFYVWEPKSSKLSQTIYVSFIIEREEESIIRIYSLQRPTQQITKANSVCEGHFSKHFENITILNCNDTHNSPFIVVSEGSDLTLISCNFETNDMSCIYHLQHLGRGIDQLTTNDDIIIVGDCSSSVTFIKYVTESRSLQIIGRDYSTRSITSLKPALPHSVCGGDRFGNVFYFELQNITQKKNLNLSMNYNIGDIITGTCFTCDNNHCIRYSTISGKLGAIIQLGSLQKDREWVSSMNEKMTVLQLVQQKTSWMFASLTNCFEYEFHNKQFPSGDVLDLDIIDIFLNMAFPKQVQVLESLSRYLDKKIDLEYISSSLNQFKNYFWNWKDRK